jgi:hypothetical protein
MDSMHFALKAYQAGDDRLGPYNLVLITERIHNLERRYLAAGIMCGNACTTQSEQEDCIKAGQECIHDLPHGAQVRVKDSLLPQFEVNTAATKYCNTKHFHTLPLLFIFQPQETDFKEPVTPTPAMYAVLKKLG